MNKWLFTWHSRLALVAFIPLLVICITGSLLVFKHEIDSVLMPEKVRVDESAALQLPRLPLDALEQSVHGALPDYEIVGWALFQDHSRADLLYVMERGTDTWQYILIDQYTGSLLAGPVALDEHLTDWLLELHYAFLIDDPGLVVTAIMAILLCWLGISGLVLHRKFWKNFFTLRWHARLVVYFSDLHKMVGVLASPILLVLGITGGYWNIAHLVEEVQEHANGEQHPVMSERLYSDEIALQQLHDESKTRLAGFEPTYISMPWEPGRDIRFFGDVHDGNPLISQYSSVVGFNAQTGEWISNFDIRDAGTGMRVLDTFRRLHFGDFGGLTSRIIWAVVGMLPLLLAVTGVSLWAIRRKKIREVMHKRTLKAQAQA